MRRLLWFAALLFSLPLFAHPSTGIVIAPNGDVFYSDLAQVWRIPVRGAAQVAVPNVHAHQLWLRPDGAIEGEDVRWMGGDHYQHRIWRRTPDGRVSDAVPWTDGFWLDYGPHFIRCGPGSPARDCSIFTRDRNGRFVNVIHQGRINHSPIAWLTTAPNRDVYVIDGPDVRRVRNGAIATIATLGPNLFGITLDRTGNLYVAAHDERIVYRISPSGQVQPVARTPAPWRPSGVAVSPRGELWILEWNGPQARARRAH